MINSTLFSKRTTNYRKPYLTFPDMIGKKNQNFKIKECKTLPMSNTESSNKNKKKQGLVEVLAPLLAIILIKLLYILSLLPPFAGGDDNSLMEQ